MNSHAIRPGMFRGLSMGVAVALALLSAGCSSFRRDARAARARTPEAGSAEGLWEGRWYKSKDPGHGGAMQMVLTRKGENLYRASARSQWWGIFRSSYDTMVVLTPVRPGEYMVQGGENIWGLGTYSMTGRIDAASFKARYEVSGQTGVLELSRPAADGAK